MCISFDIELIQKLKLMMKLNFTFKFQICVFLAQIFFLKKHIPRVTNFKTEINS